MPWSVTEMWRFQAHLAVLPETPGRRDPELGDRPADDPVLVQHWGTVGLSSNLSKDARRETFVPKIPSLRIVDLAEAMAPGIPVKEIGIRPGEKLHEVMCPADLAHLTLEFPDYYLIKPSITYFTPINYETNPLGDKGRPVQEDFEYNSANNPDFLTVEKIREMLEKW